MKELQNQIEGIDRNFWPELVDLLHHDADKDQILSLYMQVKLLPDTNRDKAAQMRGLEQAIAMKERSEQHHQRERGLLAVLETAQDLTAITDLDHVLQAIVQRARKLVGSDVGYLSIFDSSHGDFYVRATDGAFSNEFKQIRVGLEVGVCGYVARNRLPYASSDYGADSRFAHSSLIDTAMIEENIKSILGVPLLAGEQVIGVLFVGDRYVHAYSSWEKSILSTLAAHASVAIGNARLFEQEQAALRQASEMNRQLARQTADTRIAAEAHEQLTALAAKGGDLSDICAMAARMLGGRVVIYDEGEHEVCASAAQTQEIQEFKAQGAKQSYWLADTIHAALTDSRTRGRSVSAFEEGSFCRVSAVIGGRGMLGGVAIFTSVALREFEVRIFERTSMIVGVVLLTQERRESTNQLQMSAIVHGLIRQPRNTCFESVSQAMHFGVDLSRPVHMAVIEPQHADAGYVSKRLQADHRLAGIIFDQVGDRLVFVCGATAVSGLLHTLSGLCKGQPDRAMMGVVSDLVDVPSFLVQTYSTLTDCLSLLKALGRCGRVFQERELSLYAALFRSQNAEALTAYLASTLKDLYVDHVSRHSELAKTLLMYFDCGYNARGVAKRLGVHINTVHQRLEAIDLMLGDWRGSPRALELHMALRLWWIAFEPKIGGVGTPTDRPLRHGSDLVA